MKHVFVYDPKCFREQQWKMDNILDSIGQYFRTQTNPDFSTQFIRYPREAIGIIQKRAEEAGEDVIMRVYAIGEEEILFDCLNGIAEISNAELAIMSYEKKGNDFLRTFGEKKLSSFNHLPTIAAAPAVLTDLIDAGNNYVLNGCFVGMIAAIHIKTREMNKKLGKRLGGLSFFRWLMGAFSLLSTVTDKRIYNQKYTITIDDQDYSGNYSFISVANGPYYGGGKIAAPGASPEDGLLDVALMKSAAPVPTLLAMRKFSRGKEAANCVRVQAKKISIRSEESAWIQLDGEFQQDTNITFEVVPGAVYIVAPNGLTYPKPNS